MASRMYDAISTRGNHNIGSLNTKWAKHLVNGAKALENVDNFTMVELGARDEDGNLTYEYLTDAIKEGYLVTTVEEEHLLDGEEYVDFYNGKDEMGRLTRLETGVRFETSAIILNDGNVGNGGTKVETIAKDMVAHWDKTSKCFMISNAESPATAYETAKNKFVVVDEDSDFGYAFDKTTIRLECK